MKYVVKMGQILNPLDANSRLRTFETTLGINFKTYLNKYQCFFRFLFDQSSKSQICLSWLEEIYNLTPPKNNKKLKGDPVSNFMAGKDPKTSSWKSIRMLP